MIGGTGPAGVVASMQCWRDGAGSAGTSPAPAAGQARVVAGRGIGH